MGIENNQTFPVKNKFPVKVKDKFPVLIINKTTGVIFSVNERGYINYVLDSDACKLATKEEVLKLIRE